VTGTDKTQLTQGQPVKTHAATTTVGGAATGTTKPSLGSKNTGNSFLGTVLAGFGLFLGL
jgi:hypothetical protein